MRRSALFILALMAVVGGATTSCASSSSMRDRAFFQSLEVGNGGSRRVDNVAIYYGDRTIPAGQMHRTFLPSNGTPISESWVLVVPAEVRINWTSGDGQPHSALAPLRNLVPDPESFHGFRFIFVDDHVDVYALSRKPTKSKYLDIETTKVYSSAAH